METSIERAVKASGGQRALARALGIYPQAVNKWVKANRVPAERVLTVEALSGISRHDLRPDLYPEESGEIIELLNGTSVRRG